MLLISKYPSMFVIAHVPEWYEGGGGRSGETDVVLSRHHCRNCPSENKHHNSSLIKWGLIAEETNLN